MESSRIKDHRQLELHFNYAPISDHRHGPDRNKGGRPKGSTKTGGCAMTSAERTRKMRAKAKQAGKPA